MKNPTAHGPAALPALPGEEPRRPVPGDRPWHHTSVKKTLWPPQPGTKRLKDRYGAALVCVRYRHDSEGRHRYTTVEVLVDHGPVRMHRGGRKIYELAVPFWNDTLKRELLAAGATWNHDDEVWRVSLQMAKDLGLAQHIKRAGGTTAPKRTKAGKE